MHNIYGKGDPFLGSIFMLIGLILLLYVALHFAPWIIATVVGWKLFSLGMRMRGLPPVWFYISRWF